MSKATTMLMPSLVDVSAWAPERGRASATMPHASARLRSSGEARARPRPHADPAPARQRARTRLPPGCDAGESHHSGSRAGAAATMATRTEARRSRSCGTLLRLAIGSGERPRAMLFAHDGFASSPSAARDRARRARRRTSRIDGASSVRSVVRHRGHPRTAASSSRSSAPATRDRDARRVRAQTSVMSAAWRPGSPASISVSFSMRSKAAFASA
jgi:hypothetical protein